MLLRRTTLTKLIGHSQICQEGKMVCTRGGGECGRGRGRNQSQPSSLQHDTVEGSEQNIESRGHGLHLLLTQQDNRRLKLLIDVTISTFRGAGRLCTDEGPVHERLHRPEFNLKKMVQKVIKFAKKISRKLRGKSTEEIDAFETFKICREVIGTVDDIRKFDRTIEKDSDDGDDEEEASNEEAEEDTLDVQVHSPATGDEDDWNITITQAQSQLT